MRWTKKGEKDLRGKSTGGCWRSSQDQRGQHLQEERQQGGESARRNGNVMYIRFTGRGQRAPAEAAAAAARGQRVQLKVGGEASCRHPLLFIPLGGLHRLEVQNALRWGGGGGTRLRWADGKHWCVCAQVR